MIIPPIIPSVIPITSFIIIFLFINDIIAIVNNGFSVVTSTPPLLASP